MEHLTWKKSSRSAPNGGDCVEVAAHKAVVYLRDSRDPDGPVLTVASRSWKDFLEFLRKSKQQNRI
jgi:hypothetical protein